MDTIYLKIKIKKSDEFTDEIREQGLFFETIADALWLDREQIIEIDCRNYKKIIPQIIKKCEYLKK